MPVSRNAPPPEPSASKPRLKPGQRREPTPPILDAEDQALVNRMLDAGRTHEEILRDLEAAGIQMSPRTLERYRRVHLKKERAAGRPPRPEQRGTAKLRESLSDRSAAAQAQLPPAPAKPIDWTQGSVAFLRSQVQDLYTQISEAREQRNTRQVATLNRALVDVTRQLGTAEREAHESPDGIVLTPAAQVEAVRFLDAYFAASSARGDCRCPDCSRQLSSILAGAPMPEAAE